MSTTVMERTGTLEKSFSGTGMRLTPQRAAICRMLENSCSHPTAEEIYREIKQHYKTLSLMTVYNTLNRLADMGLITTVGQAGDGSEHFDGNVQPHAHFSCSFCHRIEDLPEDHTLVVQQQRLSGSGYSIIGMRMVYYGVCPQCMKRAN
jgi:Fur family peroxide stress response transcriptional regulator